MASTSTGLVGFEEEDAGSVFHVVWDSYNEIWVCGLPLLVLSLLWLYQGVGEKEWWHLEVSWGVVGGMQSGGQRGLG